MKGRRAGCLQNVIIKAVLEGIHGYPDWEPGQTETIPPFLQTIK